MEEVVEDNNDDFFDFDFGEKNKKWMFFMGLTIVTIVSAVFSGAPSISGRGHYVSFGAGYFFGFG